MRLSTSALVLSAAGSAVGFQGQKILGGSGSDKPIVDLDGDVGSWMKPLEKFFGEITDEAKVLWDEISAIAPETVEAFKKQALGARPKPASRRPDSHWDHVVKGAASSLCTT